jgi:hypothetical protein
MTNKSKQPSTAVNTRKQQPQWQYKGFVNCDLRKEDKERFKSFSDGLADADLLSWLWKMCDSGYKVSVGEGKLGLSATLANVDGPEETRGYMLSAQASYAEKAVTLLMFKHEIMLEGVWLVDITDPEDFLR